MTGSAAQAGRKGGFLANPITVGICLVVASALIIGVAIVAKNKYLGGDRVADTSKALPVDFASSLTPVDSPLVQRAQKVTFQLQSPIASGVTKVEIWDNDRPYLTLKPGKRSSDGPETVASIKFDFVPTTAGQHIVSARMTTATGKVSFPAPIVVPAADRSDDLFEKPPVAFTDKVASDSTEIKRTTIEVSPGETPKSLANRLDIPVKDLRPEVDNTMLSLPYAPGSSVQFKIPSATISNKLAGNRVHSLSEHAPITAIVKDCVLTVKLKDGVNVDGDVSLFATSPLRPGYLQIATINDKKQFTTSSLPIGKTTLMAYRGGKTFGLTSMIPVTVTIPDECAKLGWTGDARIINGMLITDKTIDLPYAYVSFDAGEWHRFPGGQGNFLQSGTINSVVPYLTTTKWDQVDIRVWSFHNKSASEVASGQYCRKNMPNPDPFGGSDSKTGCSPPGPLPQDASVNTSKGSLALDASLGTDGKVPDGLKGAFETIGQGVEGVVDAVDGSSVTPISDDPTISKSIHLTSDLPVTLKAAASKQVGEIGYQFSFFPISAQTTALNPPGVFYVKANAGAKLTVNPWKWRNAKVSSTGKNGVGLTFDDALALDTAKANLATDQDLISTLYVRAVATDHQCVGECDSLKNVYPTGIASNSIKIDMSDPATYAQLTPTIKVKPGIDTNFPTQALRGKCFATTALPDKDSYQMYPGSAPYVTKAETVIKDGTKVIETRIVKNGLPNPANSDRAKADQFWPNALGQVRCLDLDADKILADSVKAANAKAAAQCTLACKLSATLWGFAVGFIVGGPAGAVIGAAAGYYFAAELKGVTSALNGILLQYYGLVANFYNVIRTGIVNAVAKFNPVCLALKAADDDVGKGCSTVVAAAAQAVITYYTGLPPTLPTSQEIEAMASGNAEAFASTAIEVGLSQIPGVSSACSALTIDADTAGNLADAGTVAGKLGANKVHALTEQARVPEGQPGAGKISACNLLARAMAAGLRDQLTSFYSGQVAGAMEVSSGFPPGMVTEPVTDTAPEISIEAPSTWASLLHPPCPVIANATVQLKGKDGKRVLYTLRPFSSTMTWDAGAKKLKGQIRLPILPDTKEFPESLLSITPNYDSQDFSDTFLKIQVNSPCFKDLKTTFQITRTAGDRPAFVKDDRVAAYYYMAVPS